VDDGAPNVVEVVDEPNNPPVDGAGADPPKENPEEGDGAAADCPNPPPPNKLGVVFDTTGVTLPRLPCE
jgi:hypothetical protein